MAYRILLELKPESSAMKAQSLNNWTAREVPCSLYLFFFDHQKLPHSLPQVFQKLVQQVWVSSTDKQADTS